MSRPADPLGTVPEQEGQPLAPAEQGLVKGLVYRDIKPGNILLDTEGQLFVVDFRALWRLR